MSPKNLKKIQNEAARIVTGATKFVSLEALYIDTVWKSLETRRKKHKLIQFYKMNNELTPEYLSSLVPPTVGSAVRYPLRNESNLQTVPAKSNQYYESFLPSTTRLFNALSDDIKTPHLSQLSKLDSMETRLNLLLTSTLALD